MLRSNILNCTVLPEMTSVNIELAEIISYLATTSWDWLPAKQPFMLPNRGTVYWLCNNSAFTFLFSKVALDSLHL